MTVPKKTTPRRRYYSTRNGGANNHHGFDLDDFKRFFVDTYASLSNAGLFQEWFGFNCVDRGFTPGRAGTDVPLFIFRKIRQTGTWPFETGIFVCSEDDLFDVIEFLFDCSSAGVKGTFHDFSNCGWHYETFDQAAGQCQFRLAMNEILADYGSGYELSETGEVLLEIVDRDQEEVLLPGGRGGKGNNFFKTATHQSPQYAQPGEPGIEQWLILELKVLADVGLVGFPNAGKSTLLSAVSAAKPKIGDYPFTTLTPQLGIVQVRPGQTFVMADIPGIIEGAHEGRGLGHRFLRHIERNSVLLFMIPCDTPRTLQEEYDILLNELSEFNPDLLDKPRLLAITKADLIDAELEKMLHATLPKEIPAVFISAVTNKNIQALKDVLWRMLNGG